MDPLQVELNTEVSSTLLGGGEGHHGFLLSSSYLTIDAQPR